MLPLPDSQLPSRRIQEPGVSYMSDIELITGILGDNSFDTATRLLCSFESVVDLSQATVEELVEFKGIGASLAVRLKLSIELGRRMVSSQLRNGDVISSPNDAAKMLMPKMAGLKQEHLMVVLVDTRSRVIRTETIYIGSLNSSVVRVGELFKHAIKASAASVIIAHNHPSGDPSPSPDDVHVTRSIVEAGKLLGILVLDHLIIGHSRFVSLKERGLGFD